MDVEVILMETIQITLPNGIIVEYTKPMLNGAIYHASMYYADYPQNVYFLSVNDVEEIQNEKLEQFLTDYPYETMKHI